MIRRLLFCLAIILLLAAQVSAQDCKALIESPAGLAVADASGRAMHTVVAGAKGPLVAAFAPGGRVIAYSPADAARKIVLVDLEGNVISQRQIEPSSVTSIARLGWAGPRRLWYEGHTGPYLGAFELWDLPRSLDLDARRVSLSDYGHSCAISPDGGSVACLGQISGSGERLIIIKRGAGSEDPDEVYPEIEGQWTFEALTWNGDNQHLTATVSSESDRWLLTLQRGPRGWTTEQQRISDVAALTEERAHPERLLVGTTAMPVLDWLCAK